MMYSVHVYYPHPLEGLVALTQIDIDEEALGEAMRLSGAKTKKDTVNLALREFAARYRRVAALEHYAALAAGWDFAGWEHQRAAEKDPAP
jgi:Arc/MetJ family transcription regulator